jgi:hypothetical protein
MIHRALSDQAGLVLSAPAEVLEVEPQIVQAVSYSLQYRVAGYSGKFLVKSHVQNSKSDGIILNLVVRSNNIVELVNVRGRCS